jgi:hypothetical protein
MGQIQIFKIELVDHTSGARLSLAAGRELGGDFYIDLDEFGLPLFPEQAAAFALAVAQLAWRRQRAKPKPGSVWKRIVGDGVSAGFRVEFGLSDTRHVYVEVGSTKIICDDGQSDLLLAVLERFAEDIASVQQQVGDRSPEPTVAEGLRGPGLELPRWADDDQWR